MLAVYKVLRNFWPYIYGGMCIVFTDNQAVTCLLRAENPSQRLAKWQCAFLGETDWTVQFVQGTKNVVADALSRIPDFSGLNEVSGANAETEKVLVVTTRAQAHRAAKQADSAAEQDDMSCTDVRSEAASLVGDTTADFDLNPDSNVDIDNLDDSGVSVDPDLLQSIEKSQIEDLEICQMRDFIENLILPDDQKLATVIVHKRPLYQLIDGVLRHLDPHQPGELQNCVSKC